MKLSVLLDDLLLTAMELEFVVYIIHLFGGPHIRQLPTLKPTISTGGKHYILACVVVYLFYLIGEVHRNLEHLVLFCIDVSQPEVAFQRSFEVGAIHRERAMPCYPFHLTYLEGLVSAFADAFNVGCWLQSLRILGRQLHAYKRASGCKALQ